MTTGSATMRSRGVTTTSMPSDRGSMATTGVPGSSTPPCRCSSATSARTYASASIQPVSGDHSAGHARRRAARARRTSDASSDCRRDAVGGGASAGRASSAASSPWRATMSLPQRTCGTPNCAAERVQPLAPFMTEPRLQRSRRMVQAGVNDAAVVRRRLLSRPRDAARSRTRRGRAAPARARTRGRPRRRRSRQSWPT